jgi:hypothetical protein
MVLFAPPAGAPPVPTLGRTNVDDAFFRVATYLTLTHEL